MIGWTFSIVSLRPSNLHIVTLYGMSNGFFSPPQRRILLIDTFGSDGKEMGGKRSLVGLRCDRKPWTETIGSGTHLLLIYN